VRAWALAAGAVAGRATAGLLVAVGLWPVSLVGMPGERVSNMAPPTIVIARHSVALCLLVQAPDAPITALLRRRAPWRVCVGVGLVAMTLYLWHLPTLVAVTVLGHAGLGGAGPLVVWPAYAVTVTVFVRVMWPFEHRPIPGWDRAGPAKPALVLPGVPLAAVACLVLSGTGLAGFPTAVKHYAGVPLNPGLAVVALLAGSLLLWGA